MYMRYYPTLQYTQINVKELCCIAALHFSHNRVFNNECNSYPKLNVRALSCNWVVILSSADKSVHLGIFDVLMSVGVYNFISKMAGLSTRNQLSYRDEAILQIPSSFGRTSHEYSFWTRHNILLQLPSCSLWNLQVISKFTSVFMTSLNLLLCLQLVYIEC